MDVFGGASIGVDRHVSGQGQAGEREVLPSGVQVYCLISKEGQVFKVPHTQAKASRGCGMEPTKVDNECHTSKVCEVKSSSQAMLGLSSHSPTGPQRVRRCTAVPLYLKIVIPHGHHLAGSWEAAMAVPLRAPVVGQAHVIRDDLPGLKILVPDGRHRRCFN